MSRSRRTVREVVAGLFLAALAGVLVGCGGEKPAAQPVAQNTTPEKGGEGSAGKGDNKDIGLDSSIAGPLPEIERVDKQTVDYAVTNDPLREIKASGGTGSAAGPPPGMSIKGTSPRDLEALNGRSGATRSTLASGAGGVPYLNRLSVAGGAPKPAPQDANALQPPVLGPGEPFNGQNAEKYGHYRENEFRSPLTAALSTFSADVNTASYSNVRRMLTSGQLPVKDAVFLAEFVNYFPYSYAQPKGDDPVAFALEMGPCPWNRQHHLVRVGVQARQLDATQMPPRNLVFLVDTSGSMNAPNRLPLVKQSLGLLVEKLTEKDVVSIVTYAGDSRVALMPTKATEKAKITQIVTGLQAEGSTNGEGGIKTAYKLARDSFLDGGVNRVILCTDGDFNVGVTGEGELVRMIEEQRRSRVFLTILGFGMGNYKDNTLKELANHGNGHHAYIDTIDEAKKVFVEQGGALACVAKDVKFQIEFNPARVAAYRLIGYENRLLKDEDFRNDAKDAGDMGSGHQATVLYEIVPVGVKIDIPGVDPLKYQLKAAVPSDDWLTVKMRYKHPEAETSKELSAPLAGGALGKELSDDFRFAASSASFGMLLRDSQYKGVMTYAGVVEEATGCVGKDPNGHRKEFVELVKKARDLTAKPKPDAPPAKAEN